MDLTEEHIDEMALLWIGNPYKEGRDIKRRDNAQWLEAFSQDQIVAEMSNIVDNAPTLAWKCTILIAAGMYDLRQGCNPPILEQLLSEKLEQDLLKEQMNVRGVLAACQRCEEILEHKLAGSSPIMKQLREKVWAACFGDNLLLATLFTDMLRKQNVLLLGESGTGKDIVAQAVLQASFCPKGTEFRAYDSVNVNAMPESLIDSELFGHTEGAFTGAKSERKGAIFNADGGTFFIDEVGDIPLPTQTKFLRVIESGEVRQVGRDSNRQVDVRYVSATHKPLAQMIKSGEFREDLYYRLGGVVIELPPLRMLSAQDRMDIALSFLPEDNSIELLLRRDDFERALNTYHWPGNTRELRNVIYELFLQGSFSDKDKCRAPEQGDNKEDTPAGVGSGAWSLDQVKNWYIHKILHQCDFNQSRAAKRLDVSASTMSRFCKGDKA